MMELSAVAWLLLVIATVYIAIQKNRSVVGWTLLGMVFNVIALVVVALLPPLEEEEEG